MNATRASVRASRIEPFEVMDIVRAARERDEAGLQPPTCHLEVGQPSSAPPPRVLEAASAAMGRPHGYTDALGLPELRTAIAYFHLERHGVELDPRRVAVTSGASAGLVLALAALADPGELVLVTEPGYPCYANTARVLGLEVSVARLDSATGYRPSPARLDEAAAVDPAVVVVASPANPTGTVLGRSDLAGLHGWCSHRGATLVVDEIYHGTTGAAAPSAAVFDDVVVVQSFSKYFCMTGWRLGWLVLPEDLVRPVEKLAQNLYLAPPTISQHAAVAALGATDELDSVAATYRSNARVIEEVLRANGTTDIAPAEGAFYVWADVSHLGPARELCARWLDEIGVAATPGGDFDGDRGDDFVRFSVAGDPATVREAATRLDRWMATTNGVAATTPTAGRP